jgi:hypothetical protein
MSWERISLCTLLYGDYPELAQRVLTGIGINLPWGHAWVQDVRIGLNEVGDATARYVDQWAQRQPVPVTTYDAGRNVYKYPLMRRMFRDKVPGFPALATWANWFDDDSYLDPCFPWDELMMEAEVADMIGKPYVWFVRGRQWDWVQAQPWHDPRVGPPKAYRGKPVFHFFQGGWWLLRQSVICRYNWPFEELVHRGGDSTLGELMRQQGLRTVLGAHRRHLGFLSRVHTNADAAGRDSKSPRRGYSGDCLGEAYDPHRSIDLSHHHFDLTARVYATDANTGQRTVKEHFLPGPHHEDSREHVQPARTAAGLPAGQDSGDGPHPSPEQADRGWDGGRPTAG